MGMWAVQTNQDLIHTYFIEAESMDDAYEAIRRSLGQGLTPNIVCGTESGERLIGGWRLADDFNKAGDWQGYVERKEVGEG